MSPPTSSELLGKRSGVRYASAHSPFMVRPAVPTGKENAMRQVMRLAAFGFAVLCFFHFAPLASGQSAHPPQIHHYICSTQDQSRPEMYFSGAFDTKDSPDKISAAFREFLEQKYNFTNATQLSCFGSYDTLAGAEADLQKHVAQMTATKRQKVVATGWTYGSAAPAAGAATAAPPPPLQLPIKPVELSQAELDARLAQMPPDDRKHFLAEVPASKNYCMENSVISALFDCDCFAKMVLDFRIAQPNARIQAEGGGEFFPAPLNVLLTREMLYCTECISDARITKWVQSSLRASLGKGFTEAQITATSDCTAKNFLTNFRAKPYLIDERAVWTLSVGPCEKTILNIRQ
jgi:hypothetical protein